jgi:hypothetical protein
MDIQVTIRAATSELDQERSAQLHRCTAVALSIRSYAVVAYDRSLGICFLSCCCPVKPWGRGESRG